MSSAHNKNPLNTGILKKYERLDATEIALNARGNLRG